MADNGTANGHARPQTRSSLWPLVICSGGIIGCYLYYGYLQERLFQSRTLGPTFALVTACVTNVVVALVWQRVEQQTRPTTSTRSTNHKPLPHALFLATAGAYVIAMVASNEAIPQVSYPVAVLAKSCKLLPTMVVGQLAEGRRYSSQEWWAAALICAGIVGFQWSRMHQSSSSSSSSGMILLAISLVADGWLSACQNWLKRTRLRRPTAMETMLGVNLYALVYLIPLSMVNGQWQEGIEHLRSADHDFLRAITILNVTVGIGQIFVFLTIEWYSPVTTTTITTTRKFLSILLSVRKFGHAFSLPQWLAIGGVFAGLFTAIDVQRKVKVA